MKITSSTTEEQLLAPIKAAKENLRRETTEALNSDVVCGARLVEAAKRVEDAENLAHMQFRYLAAVKKGSDSRILMALLFEIVTQEHTFRGPVSALVKKWASDEIDNIRYSSN